METLLPIDLRTPASSVNEVLVACCARDRSIYVHPRVLSFASRRDKTNWAGSLLDAADRDVASKFIKASKPDGQGGSKRYWIALLSAPYTGEADDQQKGSWVGRQQDTIAYHCSTIAIVKAQRGYYLMVWDPDPNLKAGKVKARIKDVLRGLQYSLYKQLRKKSRNNIRVWYRIREDKNDENQSLQHAIGLLHQLIQIGNQDWVGDDDKRVEGCIELIYQ